MISDNIQTYIWIYMCPKKKLAYKDEWLYGWMQNLQYFSNTVSRQQHTIISKKTRKTTNKTLKIYFNDDWCVCFEINLGNFPHDVHEYRQHLLGIHHLSQITAICFRSWKFFDFQWIKHKPYCRKQS